LTLVFWAWDGFGQPKAVLKGIDKKNFLEQRINTQIKNYSMNIQKKTTNRAPARWMGDGVHSRQNIFSIVTKTFINPHELSIENSNMNVLLDII